MRKVKIAALHNNLQIPGIGEMGKTINSDNTQYKFKDSVMYWNSQEAGIELTWRGITVFLPGSNFAYLVWDKESETFGKPPLSAA